VPERYLGETLGKYRIDAVVGSGGFAWVYKAYDPELEIPVALKILKPQYAGDEKFETRFRREASTAARLRHPNIVKIFAVGREKDAVYFAMDYLPNGLSDRLAVMTTLPEAMLIRLGMDVASAIGFAHREGVIHRDIKTDNILFDEHGNAVVADFGIARAVSNYAQQTGTNMVVGTPQYFAPEQARGLSLDGRADIYALGVTLYRASTGVLPFTGEDWYEIARQHVEDRPKRPRAIVATIPREIEDIILKCMEKKPDDRYASGEELYQELGNVMQARGDSTAYRTHAGPVASTATTASAGPPIASPSLRQSGRRLAIGIGALVLAGGALFMSRRSDERTGLGAPPPPPPVDTVESVVERPLGQARTLVVEAPKASILVNGVRVGRELWQSDTMPAGVEVRIAAELAPRAAGCPTARAESTIVLDQAGARTVRLAPRGCGLLPIEGLPAGATFTLKARDGRIVKNGTLPPAAALVLPEGVYQFVVRAPLCSNYDVEVRIVANRTASVEKFRLMCGPR